LGDRHASARWLSDAEPPGRHHSGARDVARRRLGCLAARSLGRRPTGAHLRERSRRQGRDAGERASDPSRGRVTATTATAAAAPLTAEQALPEPPFSPQLVEEFVRHFVRAVKTHQLYLPNNPIYQRSIDGLRASFTPMWDVTTELVLQISESEFRWMGRSVHHEASRSESLPWVFYKDGLRELTIMQGFEQEEVGTLLDIMQRVRKASPDEDDLLTLLWEQEFAYLRYRFIDISEGMGADVVEAAEAAAAAASDPSHPPPVIPVADIQNDVASQTDQNGFVKMEDLDGSLYFLDEQEIDYLREAVQKEQALNLRRNVIEILFDIAETQPAADTRDEVCTILEQIMPH